MIFKLYIKTENAAFRSDCGDLPGLPGIEVGRILCNLGRRLPENLEVGDYGSLYDVNGNLVGKWEAI